MPVYDLAGTATVTWGAALPLCRAPLFVRWASPMLDVKSDLAAAEHHVADVGAYIVRQLAVIAGMAAAGQDTARAEARLRELELLLVLAQEHLHPLQEKADAPR